MRKYAGLRAGARLPTVGERAPVRGVYHPIKDTLAAAHIPVHHCGRVPVTVPRGPVPALCSAASDSLLYDWSVDMVGCTSLLVSCRLCWCSQGEKPFHPQSRLTRSLVVLLVGWMARPGRLIRRLAQPALARPRYTAALAV